MSHPTNPTTLDLHGRRHDEAISDVTAFLDRIRRTVAASSRGMRLGGNNILFVTIITGSGSHSAHGPVLRSAVQKLLEKRGMNFRLERGGGAFQVDALSGCDLYGPGPATCSKVVLNETEEFHRMANARRRKNSSANFAQAMAQCTGPPRNVTIPSSTCAVPASGSHNRGRSADPLPSQVASEAAELHNAVQLSVAESQKMRTDRERVNRDYEHQCQRAVSRSPSERLIDRTATPRRGANGSKGNEVDESLMKFAYEQSIADENHRQVVTERDEVELLRAIEKSVEDAEVVDGDSEEDDEELVRRALAESMALAEAEREKEGHEKDLLEKALAESALEEEMWKASERERMLQREARASEEEDMLREVMKLSLEQEQEEASAEDEAMRKAIEMSLHIC